MGVDPQAPKVSFVVSTFRRPEALRATLQALMDLDWAPARYEVIVVDDGSGDSTPEVVGEFTSLDPPVIYIAQENSGVATARNVGAARATGALLIFLDDDMLVERDHISRHLAVRARYEDCLVNGHWEFAPETRRALESTPFGRYRLTVEDWVKAGLAKEQLDDGRLKPAGVTACNLSISATRFRDLGGFDESFPFAGCEDQEFSYRAERAGLVFIYDPSIRLLHDDQRVSLAQFCGRQERGALTSVHLVVRHPERFADRQLLFENAPITRYDPFRLRLKKMGKRLYSTRPGLVVAHLAVRVLERVSPDGRLLRRVYTMTIGAHIYRGVREGLRVLPEAGGFAEQALRRRYAGS